MADPSNFTALNIGIRRMIYSLNPPAFRNFEPAGTQYVVVRATGYEYQGTVYTPGQTIPYDVSGTSYGNLAQLERDFNSGLIDPAT